MPGDRRHEGQGARLYARYPLVQVTPSRSSKRAVSRPAQGVKLTRRTCKSCRLSRSSGPLQDAPGGPLQNAPGRKARTGPLVSGLPSFPSPWHAGCVLKRRSLRLPDQRLHAFSRLHRLACSPFPRFSPPGGARRSRLVPPRGGEGGPRSPLFPVRLARRSRAERIRKPRRASETGSTEESEMKGLLALLATIAVWDLGSGPAAPARSAADTTLALGGFAVFNPSASC